MEESVDMSKTVSTETSENEEFSHLENAKGGEDFICTCGSAEGCVLHPEEVSEGSVMEEDEIPDAPDIEEAEEEKEQEAQSPALTPLNLEEKSVLITFPEGSGKPEFEFKGEWRGLFKKRAMNAFSRAYRLYQKERIKNGRRE